MSQQCLQAAAAQLAAFGLQARLLALRLVE